MRLLLDTQVALWWLVGSPRLGKSTRGLMAERACVLSVASVWEVAIKHRLGRLPIPPQRFRDEMRGAGATILPIGDAHAIATAALAVEHRDPFDRLLLATAQIEDLSLLTADEALVSLGRRDPELRIRPVS